MTGPSPARFPSPSPVIHKMGQVNFHYPSLQQHYPFFYLPVASPSRQGQGIECFVELPETVVYFSSY